MNLLLSHNIKPILVFDGQHLPAKAATESKRRESRKDARKMGMELLREGKTDEARNYLRRCVDITHEMALQLIKVCRTMNVDCIVAPYEADAQLAYLNKIKIADYVITEDSDLVLFGCSNILFKLDLNGSCLLVEGSKLHLTMGINPTRYSFNKFRYMCILSGCDYLNSLPGVGLARACKFILKYDEDVDIRRAISRLPYTLNMQQIKVTDEYIEDFMKAVATFHHMMVYDPFERRVVPLNDPKETGYDENLCSNAGKACHDNEMAFQMALGNIDPFSLKKLDDWNPDRPQPPPKGVRSKSWSQPTAAKHHSIWRSKISEITNRTKPSQKKSGKITSSFKVLTTKSFQENQQSHLIESEFDEETTETDILAAYTGDTTAIHFESNTTLEKRKKSNSPQKSPASKRSRRNPFMKTESPTKSTEVSSFLKTVSPVKRIESFSHTKSIESAKTVLSKFFASPSPKSKALKESFYEIVDVKENGIISTLEVGEDLNLDSHFDLCENENSELNTELENNKISSILSQFSFKNSTLSLSESKVMSAPESSAPSNKVITANPNKLLEIESENISTEDCVIIVSPENSPVKEKSTSTIARDKLIFVKSPPVPVKKAESRRIGLSRKIAATSSTGTQSRLSQFGFQKRPGIKLCFNEDS